MQLMAALMSLSREIERSPICPLQKAASHFHATITKALANSRLSVMLKECDNLRDVLRAQGLDVHDGLRRSKR